MSPKILVIDDDRKNSTKMMRGLVYEGFDVIVAENGTDGLHLVLEETPDLIIMDAMIPGMDGLEVCRRIRKAESAPIFMVTARDSVSDKVASFETGADDYLVKPFAFEEFTARVKALLRRTYKQAKADVLRFSDLTLDLGTRTATRGSRQFELSTTEFHLLSYFLAHPRQVLSRDFIMQKVWGYDFNGESNVLEVYIGYLRHKTEEHGETRLIHTIRGAGYVMRVK